MADAEPDTEAAEAAGAEAAEAEAAPAAEEPEEPAAEPEPGASPAGSAADAPADAAAPPPTAQAPVHLLPLSPAPPAHRVDRVVRAAYAAHGLPEILEQPRTEAEAITVQLAGVTPKAATIRPASRLRFVVRFYDFAAAPTPPASLRPLPGYAPLVLRPDAEESPPGVVLRFELPCDAAENARLSAFMRSGSMQLEAWDETSLLLLGTARVGLADLAAQCGEVWHEASLIEPVVPGQDAEHAGRCCGTLQLRVARAAGRSARAHAAKTRAQLQQTAEEAEAPPSKVKRATSKAAKLEAERDRKLLRLNAMQAAELGAADASRLAQHNSRDAARTTARKETIRSSLESGVDQEVRVECSAIAAPFFEHELVNLNTSRKQKYAVLCSAEKAGLTAPHHSGAALELVTDSGQWNALKAAHGLETPTSAAVCAAVREEPKEPAADGKVADASYTIELGPGERAFLPFYWRLLGASDAATENPLGFDALVGSRPLPTGAEFAAQAGLLHAVGSGRQTIDTASTDHAVAAGRVKITGPGTVGVVARLAVSLLPRPLVIDETLHLYGAANCMLNATVPIPAERLPGWRTSSAGAADSGGWRVACPDPSVVASVDTSVTDATDTDGATEEDWELLSARPTAEESSPHAPTIQLVTRCGAPQKLPQVVYVFLYADNAPSKVSATLQVLLTTARTCRVYAGRAGQANHGSMLLPSAISAPGIEHFSADPAQLMIAPLDPFGPEATGQQEVSLSVSTVSSGNHCWRCSSVAPAGEGGEESPVSRGRAVLEQCLVFSSVPPVEISRKLAVRVTQRVKTPTSRKRPSCCSSYESYAPGACVASRDRKPVPCLADVHLAHRPPRPALGAEPSACLLLELASLLRCELRRLPPRLRTTAHASVHPSRESPTQPSRCAARRLTVQGCWGAGSVLAARRRSSGSARWALFR